MIVNRIVVLFVFIGVLWSCNNDDSEVATPDPPRLLSEVLAEDEVKIQEYLRTHYYNYAEFQNPPENFDYKIKLMEIPEDDSTGIIPLIDSIQSIDIQVPSSHFLIDEDEGMVTHKLYYLSAREGVGESLSVADSAFVRYEGQLLDDVVFDDSNSDNAVWFDLAILQAPATSLISGTAARGFSEGVRNFKSGKKPVIPNDDGTYTVEDYGVGLMIFPSGLGYYNLARTTIPSYSPLIFTIDLFAVNQTDHDGDGKISIEEDTNGDGYLFNDDADEDGLPDYLDVDSN